jgi:hypothetical protein
MASDDEHREPSAE